MERIPGDAFIMSDNLRLYTCKEVNELLMDYLESRLSPHAHKEMDYHISLCHNCVKFIKTYKKTIELTGKLSVKKMPQELEKTLLRFLTKRS